MGGSHCVDLVTNPDAFPGLFSPSSGAYVCPSLGRCWTSHHQLESRICTPSGLGNITGEAGLRGVLSAGSILRPGAAGSWRSPARAIKPPSTPRHGIRVIREYFAGDYIRDKEIRGLNSLGCSRGGLQPLHYCPEKGHLGSLSRVVADCFSTYNSLRTSLSKALSTKYRG